MNPIERLFALSPWEQISEEDFFWVGGLYVSIRGNFAQPRGAFFCPSQKAAEQLLKQSKGNPPAGLFVLTFPPEMQPPGKLIANRADPKAPTATTTIAPKLAVADGRGGSRPCSVEEEKRVLSALERCLNVFEDRSDSGVKFPVSLSVDADW